MAKCECEHKAHFDTDARTPNGNPGHKYDQGFENIICNVRTPYGIYHVCEDCNRDCIFVEGKK